MRFPSQFYTIQDQIGEKLPNLRPAQLTGLTLWVIGTILAHSSCQDAVIDAIRVLVCSSSSDLVCYIRYDTLRQYIREWLYDGKDRLAPCSVQLDVGQCFAPLLRWVLSWWKSNDLALAIDETKLFDKLRAVVISVLYRGTAVPIAWRIFRAREKGEHIQPIVEMLHALSEAIPSSMRVIVMTDRGLFSRTIFQTIKKCGFHPFMRVCNDIYFAPHGTAWAPALALLKASPGAWAGEGTAFKGRYNRLNATLLMFWGKDYKEPWLVVTDLPPDQVNIVWYGLRMWIELGFRVLKSVGWQWQRTRRSDPDRVSRHWLVLSVSTLWVLAYGTHQEEMLAGSEPPRNKKLTDGLVKGVKAFETMLTPLEKRPEEARDKYPQDNGDNIDTGGLQATVIYEPGACKKARVASHFRLGRLAFEVKFLLGRLIPDPSLKPQPWPAGGTGLQFFAHSPPAAVT